MLHVYHHAATLVLCWTQLRGETSLQWLVIIINLAVHVLMYAYYALQAIKYDVWWKRYLTIIQITQFIVALVVCIAIYGTYLAQLFGITGWKCHGDFFSATFAIIILSSYLVLFILFYNKTYTPETKIK